MEITTRVKPPARRQLLLDYMSRRFTYRSRENWRRLIEGGFVRCNGAPASLETLVSAGDELTTLLPDASQPEANFDYTIVYEDRWLLAVNKPANLRVHGRGAFIHANLIHHLRHERSPAYPEAELINRLDGDTSGAVLLARDKTMLKEMQHLFRTRQIGKYYNGWVHGIPRPAERVINRPIGRLPSLSGVYRYGSGQAANNPKPAATRLSLEVVFDHQFARLSLRPYTGRTHQLRVHLAAVGHPLVGDLVYQLSDEAFLAYHANPGSFPPPLLNRHALHCSGYAFVHPVTGRWCRIEAPLAADLIDLEDRLIKNGGQPTDF